MINYHWSRVPGKFVDKITGVPYIEIPSISSVFLEDGGVRLWYETLIEVIIDLGIRLVESGVDLHNVEMTTNANIDLILQCSVLHGRRSMNGLQLETKVLEGAQNSIEFIDRTTGELLGTVRILDIEVKND